MTGITATEARSNLYRLIDETAEAHQSIVIMGKRHRLPWFHRKIGLPFRKHFTCSPYSVFGLQRPRIKRLGIVDAGSGRL